MKIRSITATLAILAGVLAAGTLPASASTTLAASSASCTTTHTSTHRVTSTGSQSWETLTKIKCGKNYQEWETLKSDYSTGARSYETAYKNEYAYPHYTRHEVLQHWTAKGTYSVTVTDTRA